MFSLSYCSEGWVDVCFRKVEEIKLCFAQMHGNGMPGMLRSSRGLSQDKASAQVRVIEACITWSTSALWRPHEYTIY